MKRFKYVMQYSLACTWRKSSHSELSNVSRTFEIKFSASVSDSVRPAGDSSTASCLQAALSYHTSSFPYVCVNLIPIIPLAQVVNMETFFVCFYIYNLCSWNSEEREPKTRPVTSLRFGGGIE